MTWLDVLIMDIQGVGCSYVNSESSMLAPFLCGLYYFFVLATGAFRGNWLNLDWCTCKEWMFPESQCWFGPCAANLDFWESKQIAWGFRLHVFCCWKHPSHKKVQWYLQSWSGTRNTSNKFTNSGHSNPRDIIMVKCVTYWIFLVWWSLLLSWWYFLTLCARNWTQNKPRSFVKGTLVQLGKGKFLRRAVLQTIVIHHQWFTNN